MRFAVQRWTSLVTLLVVSFVTSAVVQGQPTTLSSPSTAPTTSPSTRPAPRKTVKLLTVGNSFANNSTRYLNGIAIGAGNALIMGRANNSGRSLEQHWKAAEAFEANPADPAGLMYPTTTGQPNASLSQLLKKDQWDFVTIQQASYWSDQPESYHPYAEKLYDYIKARAPQAEVVIHQTWAYRNDHPRFKDGKQDAAAMHAAIRAAYHALADQLKLRIIPVGDAMFAAVTSPDRLFQPDAAFDITKAVYPALPVEANSMYVGWSWGKTKSGERKLEQDGAHASVMGCYLGAAVFYEFLYEEDVRGNAFVPAGLKPEDTAWLQKVAHEAIVASRPGPTTNSVANATTRPGDAAQKTVERAK